VHNIHRDNYLEIAIQMLNAPYLDVIMGTGHPNYDDDGQLRPPPTNPISRGKRYLFVGGERAWRQLRNGVHPAGWKLIENKADFVALAEGPTPPKVLGTAQVWSTLQASRGRAQAPTAETSKADASRGPSEPPPPTAPYAPTPAPNPTTPSENANKPLKSHEPFQYPFIETVPDLATMTRAALNCLDDNPRGFYLMIEGGAVDWANHRNDAVRMIEEQIDFLNALEAVIAWVEKNSNWEETLLILTADHETGMLWGPDSDKVPFQPLEDRGKGKVPGLRYHSKGHTNSLVPVYARGRGSDRFAALTRGTDQMAASLWSMGAHYIHLIDIFQVMAAEIAPTKDAKVQEPPPSQPQQHPPHQNQHPQPPPPPPPQEPPQPQQEQQQQQAQPLTAWKLTTFSASAGRKLTLSDYWPKEMVPFLLVAPRKAATCP
jgi:alkaline phosphatase